MGRVQLRQLDHPDLWNFVVHLTGRPGARDRNLLPSVAAMSPAERLTSILRSRRITATRPFRAPYPYVSFTESTPAGIEYLVGQLGYAPWGIVFPKACVYEHGGGPVHYVRGDEWDDFQVLSARMRSRAVRFEPGESEWLHEREWRAPGTGGPLGFRFDTRDVHAVIVGSADWPPEEYVDLDYSWPWGDVVEPAWAVGINRWIWSGSQLHQMRMWS